MITSSLLALTLALAPTTGQTTVDIWATGSVAVGHFEYDSSLLTHRDQLDGSATAGANFYLRPVHDDDAAPSLQPFLQRIGSAWLSGGGGGISSSAPGQSSSPTTGYGQLTAGIDGYFGPHQLLYSGASFNFFDYTSDSNTTITLMPQVRFGVRLGDLRIAASYSLMPIKPGNGGFQVDFYGQVGLELYGIVGRKLELTASGTALKDGGGGRVAATRWLARRFGIGLALQGGHESISLAEQKHEYLGGSVNFTAWINRHFAVQASYVPQWDSFYGAFRTPNEGGWTHALVLGLTGRP